MTLIKNNLYLIGFGLLFYVAYLFVVEQWFYAEWLEVFIFKSHLFLFVITFFIVNFLWFLHQRLATYTGFLYLFSVLLKMGLSIYFLYPHIVKKYPELKQLVVHFFLAFFSYLIIEVILLLKLVKKAS